MKKIDNKGYILICFFSIIYSFLLQLFLIPRLPAKYFYDSNGILTIINNTITSYFDSSYMFTGNFFKAINIFGLTTFNEWAYLITLVMSIITFIFFIKYRNIKFVDLIFIFATITLANIYVFRVSKDFIQLFFWIMMYLIYKFCKSDKMSCFLILIIFCIEGIFFRSYYLGMGILFLIILTLLNNNKKINTKKIVFYIVIGLILGLLILSKISPSLYDQIVNMRFYQNRYRIDSVDAVTAINDVFQSTNPFIYSLNYIINLFRIMIPLELLTKGLKYIPFVVYQIYLTYSLIKKTKSVSKSKYILLAIIISYFAVANLFEPDFGSVVRHEVTLYFILFDFLLERSKVKNEFIDNKHGKKY